jgi:hypothetical protein
VPGARASTQNRSVYGTGAPMTKPEQALDLFSKEYNCAQAILAAYGLPSSRLRPIGA